MDAVGTCRQRCWRADWVIDLDIQAFFDSVPWDLILKAVEHHTDQPWVLLYVRRWLDRADAAARWQRWSSGIAEPRRGRRCRPCWRISSCTTRSMRGWSGSSRPFHSSGIADDVVVHCVSEAQARQVWAAIAERMESVGLRLHPDKTQIVYCGDSNRRREFECVSFTFLGYTFRPRESKSGKTGTIFTSFQPAMSPVALKSKSQELRRWRIHRRTSMDLRELAEWLNPIVRGWMNYYGEFNRFEMYSLLQRINTYLMRWARKKYKRLRSWKRFKAWWRGVTEREPELFAHWAWMRAYQWTRATRKVVLAGQRLFD